MMTRDLRTARLGAILTFVLAGLLCGTFTVRIPALADKFGLTEASVGAVLLAWGLGALAAMQAMRGLISRFGSRAVLRVGGPLCAATLILVALVPGYPLVIAAAATFGMAFGAVDVAMNAQGSAIERAAERPLMNGMHAGWCIGAIAAGLLGTGAIALGLSFTANLALIAALALPMLVLVGRTYLPEPRRGARHGARSARRRMSPVVYLLGVIAFCAFMVEGVVADWNGLFLRDVLGAPEAVAALGYPIFEAGMLAGRVTGDRLRMRMGARLMIIISGLATAVTFGIVIAAPSAVVAVCALLVVGMSVATVSPMALSLAGTATDDPGAAIAQTGAMGYAGLLLGPVIIAVLSEHSSLRTALVTAVVLGVLIAVAARLLPGARRDRGGTRPGSRTADATEPHELLPAA
jgi:MFS family permease